MVYSQRKKINTEDFGFSPEEMQKENTMTNPNGSNPLEGIQNIQSAMAREVGQDAPNVVENPIQQKAEQPFEISGNIPPAFRDVLMQKAQSPTQPQGQPTPVDHTADRLEDLPLQGTVRQKSKPVESTRVSSTSQASSEFLRTKEKIRSFHTYDEIELPSKSKFYSTIPPIIHVRPMTGEEENILATPRYVKKGKAVDKIFENVIQENIDTTELLSIDRSFLLIFLRGISYTPEYDVEVKCPSCDVKFNTMIDLNMMEVTMCPDDFGPDSLEGKLPRTGLDYKYRLSTGDDEQRVTRHREMHVKEFGDQREDDTLLYRSALLLEYIDEVTNTNELLALLRDLPVEDVNFIRNMINEPPFGVDSEIGLVCPSCTSEFEIQLPMEASFFFPRKKKE